MNDKKFNKDRLPTPEKLLEILGLSSTKNVKGFFELTCPFHEEKDNKKRTLHLHHERGYFKCHTCNSKGGDVLSFYMKVKGQNFIEAAKMLGAWDDHQSVF
jgi:DNA primase